MWFCNYYCFHITDYIQILAAQHSRPNVPFVIQNSKSKAVSVTTGDVEKNMYVNKQQARRKGTYKCRFIGGSHNTVLSLIKERKTASEFKAVRGSSS